MSSARNESAEVVAKSDERGFSLVEVLVVVALIGILTNLGYQGMVSQVRRARAAAIVSDFLLIRQAALQGKVEWVNNSLGVKYDWENWIKTDGTPKHKSTGVAYGLSVVVSDPLVLEGIRHIYDGPFHQSRRDRRTFVIEYLDGGRPD